MAVRRPMGTSAMVGGANVEDNIDLLISNPIMQKSQSTEQSEEEQPRVKASFHPGESIIDSITKINPPIKQKTNQPTQVSRPVQVVAEEKDKSEPIKPKVSAPRQIPSRVEPGERKKAGRKPAYKEPIEKINLALTVSTIKELDRRIPSKGSRTSLIQDIIEKHLATTSRR